MFTLKCISIQKQVSKTINTFIQQWSITFFKSDSKDIYNVISMLQTKFELSIHQRILKNYIMASTKIYDFNINNNKCWNISHFLNMLTWNAF